MKLIRFGQKGKEKPGLWKDGGIVDLRKIFSEVPDIGEAFFRDGWLEKISEITDPGRKINERIACPVSRPSKIVCLGKNYAEHAREGGFEKPDKPLIFCKTWVSLILRVHLVSRISFRFIGRITVKVDPLPISLSAVISPLWFCKML